MSYSHCRACHKEIHTSDLELTGSPTRDCQLCDYTCNIDTDTDGDIVYTPTKITIDIVEVNSRGYQISQADRKREAMMNTTNEDI